MEIIFDNYIIRSYEKSDKDALINYGNNYNVFKHLKNTFPHPYTEDDAILWLTSCAAQNPETCFAIADENELIGGIGFHLREDVFKHNAEIGYWIGEPFWGKHIVSRALKEMTKFIFNNFKINRIYASVFEGNPASVRVLEKCEYKPEAVLRKAVFKENKFLDQYIFALLKEEFIKLYE
ncbi:MAG: GNAT family N-acetyltransferase [Ignavibacteriaceae bacterium]|nr:GNAT family N-acetyltransferase [Ignavibacteriaceae bacterium]